MSCIFPVLLPCKSASAFSAGFACWSAFALWSRNISSPLGVSAAASEMGGVGGGGSGRGGGKAGVAPGKFDLRILRAKIAVVS